MSLQKQTKVLFSSHDRDVNGMVGWSQTLPKPLRNMRCKLRCVVTYNLKTWSISNKILIVVEIISRTPPEIFYRASNTGNVLTRALVSFFLICFRRKTCGGDDFVLALGQYHWVYFDVKPLARFWWRVNVNRFKFGGVARSLIKFKGTGLTQSFPSPHWLQNTYRAGPPIPPTNPGPDLASHRYRSEKRCEARAIDGHNSNSSHRRREKAVFFSFRLCAPWPSARRASGIVACFSIKRTQVQPRCGRTIR